MYRYIPASTPVLTPPLLLQIADVQVGTACVWAWYPWSEPLSLRWQVKGAVDLNAQQQVVMPQQSAGTGWTSTYYLSNLPPASEVQVTVCQAGCSEGESTVFSTPGNFEQALSFGWGGDVCGQGYGRHAVYGLPIFDVLARQSFDFFILCGDLIYADHALPALRYSPMSAYPAAWPNRLDNPLADWAGLPAPTDVASTVDAFRSRYLYLFADTGFRRFVQDTPMVYVLDDHEIYNNFTRETSLIGDCRYPLSTIFSDLQRCGLQAWREFAPSGPAQTEPNAAPAPVAPGFKYIRRGPLLDLFVVDARTQRSANSCNRQTQYGPDCHWLGPAQLAALRTALKNSNALWKVLVSGSPLSILIPDSDASTNGDGQTVWDGVSNGDDGPPTGREIELSMLLSGLKEDGVENLVVLSGDVHFASATYYCPQAAAFKDFMPFWEFTNGPLHAGGFPTKGVDGTFGATQVFTYASPHASTPPGPLCTSFGTAHIDLLFFGSISASFAQKRKLLLILIFSPGNHVKLNLTDSKEAPCKDEFF